MNRRSARRSRRLFTTITVLLTLGLIGASAVALNYDALRAQYLKLTTLDFEGPGVGEVVVRIESGEDGLAISQKLVDAGVIRDFDSFYRYLIETNPVFYPGSFTLKLKMSNKAAVEVLSNSSNVMTYKVTLPEGYRAVQIFEELSRVSGIPIGEFELAAKDLKGLGIPDQALTVEGYLFPATYSFDKEASAKDIIMTMVTRMEKELEQFRVPVSQWHELLTLASIVQREAKHEEDFFKVSRVFANRIERDMPLETDPTISYSYSGKDMSEVSKEEQLKHGYNTYLVKGLPPGPIASPGALAIEATLNPAAGDWLFFVTIDLATGETKFSKTLAQHEEYVKLLRKWELENPGWYDN
ncbi:MAG: endolytic transglycosylase MltG [Actinobacteria bacterium]|nr:endolytic transglycosylase MltG [Actinomycetota bacterium]